MDAATEDSAPRAPGAILAAERERQGLARADIAQRLHMSVSQVEALEAGDYSRLPRGTFLRGFVRNYARVLGIDPGSALESLSEAAPREAAPGIVVPSQNIRFDPLGERFASPYVKAAGIALAVLVAGFAAMYWWLFIRPTAPAAARKPATEVVRLERAVPPAPAPAGPPKAPAEGARTEVPAPAKPEAVKPEVARPEAPAAAKVAAAKPEPAKPEPPKPEPARPEPAKAPEAAVASLPPGPTTVDASRVIASGGSVIRFQFKGSSWVEIRDGRGKVLLSRVNPGGSEAEVIGRPPFSVVVGNAPEVRMFYNNREFDLEPHTRVAVARFTVE